MDMVKLRTLMELAHEGTMAKAADNLGFTPSAVSQHISALEEESGVTLTQRCGRGVRLTPAGEVLARHAERLFLLLDEANAELAQLKAQVAGNVRVAAFASIALALLPAVIAQLAARYPKLHVTFEEMEPGEGLSALGAWRCDIALLDDLSLNPGVTQDNLAFVPLLEDRLFALVSDNHPLAGQSTCSLADLRGDAFAMDLSSSTFRLFVQKLCNQQGFEPRVNASSRSFETILALVAAGCSVSVAPGLWLKHSSSKVNAIALQPEEHRKILIAWRRGERHHPAITLFIEEMLRARAGLFVPN